MMKIIADTNIFLSAFLFKGMSKEIFDLVLTNQVTLCASNQLQAEITRKLIQLQATPLQIQQAQTILQLKAHFFVPTIVITVCRDVEDNFLLELAETAQADYLITFDKDLLSLPDSLWKETKILKPGTFLQIWRLTA